MARNENTTKTFIGDFLEILVIGIAVFALAWIFLAEPLEVTGESMEPTLHNSEQIIVEKLSMSLGELQRGDIVVFNSPEEPDILVVKRLIGLPGDKVLIQEGEVYLNGEKLSEIYIGAQITQGKNKLPEGKLATVPTDTYFVLGDNRSNSTDSRDFGPVKQDEIVGKAVVVYYPFSNFRKIEH